MKSRRAGFRQIERVRNMTPRPKDLGLPEDIVLLGPQWPADNVPRQAPPGDLSQFAANQGPRPTDLTQFHPFRFDPKINAGGGLIYFDECAGSDELKATLGLMGVYHGTKDFAVFAGSAHDPAEEHFLDQLRFISLYTLESGYFVWKERPAAQKHSLWEIMEAFITGQKAKWGRGGLSGTRGGDGDSAKET